MKAKIFLTAIVAVLSVQAAKAQAFEFPRSNVLCENASKLLIIGRYFDGAVVVDKKTNLITASKGFYKNHTGGMQVILFRIDDLDGISGWSEISDVQKLNRGLSTELIRSVPGNLGYGSEVVETLKCKLVK